MVVMPKRHHHLRRQLRKRIHHLQRRRRTTSLWMIGLVVFIAVMAAVSIYLFWRFRQSTGRLSVVVRDEATQTEQQIITTADTESIFPREFVSFRKVGSIQRDRIEAAQLSYLKSSSLRSGLEYIDKYELIYLIHNEKDQPTPVKASIYIPNSGGQQKPWYVFAAGTSGLAQKCAPSLERVEVTNIGNYENQMIAQAAENYVVIFPEYVGFYEINDLQPYFIEQMEARTVLGAIANFAKVVESQQLINLQVGDIYLTGYSQGGHAALSAAEHRQWLDDNLQQKIKGIIGYASASDIIALLHETPRLGPYVIYSYFNYYGPTVNLPLIIQQRWLDTLTEKIETTCIDRTGNVWPNNVQELYTEQFANALLTGTLQSNFSSLYDYLQSNMSFSDLKGIPIYLQQGATDPIVTAVTQRKNQQQFCQQGYDVLYQEYAGVNHYQIRQSGFYDGIRWMNAVSSGRTPDNNCPTYNSY